MKRILSVLLCAALLGGCGSLNLTPSRPQEEQTPQVGPTQAPTRLAVFLNETDEVLKPVFEAYGAEQNVTVEYVSQQECDLAVLRTRPGEGWGGLEEDSLYSALCGMLGVDQGEDCLPMGSSGYGYLVNTQMLGALLGEGALLDLQRCSYQDWAAFCQALAGWIASPSAQKVDLNENTYTLPSAKDETTGSLEAVFLLADGESSCYGGQVLSYALAASADSLEALTAGALSGPAGALYDAFCLEADSLWRPEGGQEPMDQAQAEEAFLNGKALFYRADTVRGSVLAGQGMSPGLLGLKLDLGSDEIGAQGLDAEQLRSWPVVGTYRYLALREEGDTGAAQAFMYWLYVSHQGQRMLTDTLGLVQSGLRSPSGEPGRSLYAFVQAGETLPAFSAQLSDEALAGAGALIPGAGALESLDRQSYSQGLCGILCPAG